MTYKLFAVFFAFFLASEPSLAKSSLTLERIQKTYRGMTQMEGEAEQIKTSPLLLRPLKSNVSLRFDKGLLTWQVEGQEAWQLRFDKNSKPKFINGEKTIKQIPADARDKLDRTISLVHNILTMDPKLDDDFSLSLDKNILTILPKAGKNTVFFQSIAIEFKSNIEIQSISFKTQDDETKLLFKRMKFKSS
ncbi:MAG: hypothetical protein EOP07_25860 [Proteobacteria bacterium]|nr:MAG: hypothetical protein EOP07_25875 [Pseudomonadota bacterium]RYZ48382.1 MAG: hypothetical protein EOP07_25860 [Pseudomonadota bacterium]